MQLGSVLLQWSKNMTYFLLLGSALEVTCVFSLQIRIMLYDVSLGARDALTVSMFFEKGLLDDTSNNVHPDKEGKKDESHDIDCPHCEIRRVERVKVGKDIVSDENTKQVLSCCNYIAIHTACFVHCEGSESSIANKDG